jgi:SAM-dependent methyltransferase
MLRGVERREPHFGDELRHIGSASSGSFERGTMTDHRLQAPATLRNREPILDVLREVLPPSGLVLEIASGSGEHAVYFAQHLPRLTFQPSDPDAAALQSIAAWTRDAGVTNVLPPVLLDASSSDWPAATADAMICINMIHISPWRASEGLMQGAAKLLRPGSPLYLYGPYRRADVVTAPSNDAFDAALRERNAEWGLRDLEAVAKLAHSVGFSAPAITEMPANNLSVVFRRN